MRARCNFVDAHKSHSSTRYLLFECNVNYASGQGVAPAYTRNILQRI